MLVEKKKWLGKQAARTGSTAKQPGGGIRGSMGKPAETGEKRQVAVHCSEEGEKLRPRNWK